MLILNARHRVTLGRMFVRELCLHPTLAATKITQRGGQFAKEVHFLYVEFARPLDHQFAIPDVGPGVEDEGRLFPPLGENAHRHEVPTVGRAGGWQAIRR